MAISADYPTPVMVNGFSCKNCTEVDEAKKHIDPAHPKDGPYGVDAKDKPGAASDGRSPAVTFGGGLAALAKTNTANPSATSPLASSSAATRNIASAASATSGLGVRLDVSV